MKDTIAGFDVGGTKISVSLGTKKGQILDKKIFSSGRIKSVKELLNEGESVLSELLGKVKKTHRNLLGIGIAAAGAVDSDRQMILKAPNLPSWEDFPLKKYLSKRLKVPVWIENDANAAALGEQYFGSGKGTNDFLYVTVSTGIGSGIVSNGSLVRGNMGTAGEVGHMTMVKDGFLCGCGKKGCLEAYASGTAIANHVKRAVKEGAKSRFFTKSALNEITGKLVCQAAKQKDPVAIKARELAADYLGIALANLINVLNPEKIILGGGVMEETDYFWVPMMKAAKREAWTISFESCEIVKSKLGTKVGDLGAIAIVLDSVAQRSSTRRP